jgi:hypothetical protein
MLQTINEKVSVITLYNHQTNRVSPKKIKWNGKIYPINLIGYHHRYQEGNKLIHIFSVSNRNLFFRLKFDTQNLEWILEEISDGLAN